MEQVPQEASLARRALIVVDVQNDFCEGGSLPVRGGAAVALRIHDLLVGDHGYDFVVATRDHHIDPGSHFSMHPDFMNSWPVHCVAGTDGAGFHPNLDPQPFAAVFDKGEMAAAYSGFEGVNRDGVGLHDWLLQRHVSDVDVVGIATDYCVRATALDAAGLGLNTLVRLDLTAAVAAESAARTLNDLAAAGVTMTGAPFGLSNTPDQH